MTGSARTSGCYRWAWQVWWAGKLLDELLIWNCCLLYNPEDVNLRSKMISVNLWKFSIACKDTIHKHALSLTILWAIAMGNSNQVLLKMIGQATQYWFAFFGLLQGVPGEAGAPGPAGSRVSIYNMITKWHIAYNTNPSSRYVRWTRTDGMSIYFLPRVTEDSLVSVVPLALLVLLALVVLLVQLVMMVPRWVSPVLTHFIEVILHMAKQNPEDVPKCESKSWRVYQITLCINIKMIFFLAFLGWCWCPRCPWRSGSSRTSRNAWRAWCCWSARS